MNNPVGLRRNGYRSGMTTPYDADDSPPPDDTEGDPAEKERERTEREEGRETIDPETGEPEGPAEAGVQPRS
jgi:hypothetical protein